MSKLTYGGHTYLVVTETFDWSDAKANAEKMGGHLVTINSAKENAAIFNFVMKESLSWSGHYIAPDGGNAEYVWIGASDRLKEGQWKWTDNTSVKYSNWGYGGEPDDYLNRQDGGALGLEAWPWPKGGLGNAGQWNDINVTNGLFSIVEFDGIAGTSKADIIKGTSAADVLIGLSGNDALTGGSGDDAFVFNTKLGSFNIDKITDFRVVDDTIRLDNIVFTKVGANGALTASAFYSNTTGKAHDASDRIIYEKDTGKLFYDADGTGKIAGLHFATLANKAAVTVKDFYVI